MPKGASTCAKKEIVGQLVLYLNLNLNLPYLIVTYLIIPYLTLPYLPYPTPTHHPFNRGIYIYFSFLQKKKKKIRDGSKKIHGRAIRWLLIDHPIDRVISNRLVAQIDRLMSIDKLRGDEVAATGRHSNVSVNHYLFIIIMVINYY